VHCIPGGFNFSEVDVGYCVGSDFMFDNHLGGEVWFFSGDKTDADVSTWCYIGY